MPQAHRAAKLLRDWRAGEFQWNMLFYLWDYIFQYSYSLSFYLHFLHLIRALFANTGTLSLTSNRIKFSNNLQSKAYKVIALTIQSLTSEVTTISSSYSLSCHYRSPNLHALQREIHLQNYRGRNSQERVFSNIWGLLLPSLCEISFLLLSQAPYVTRAASLYLFTLCLPKEDFK